MRFGIIVLSALFAAAFVAVFALVFVFSKPKQKFTDMRLNLVNYKNSEFPLKLFCDAKYNKPTFTLTPDGRFLYK